MNTICGTGVSGSTTDGAPATATKVSSATTLWGDTLGNIFYLDVDYKRLRKIDVVTSIVSTVVGNGVGGFTGENTTGTSTSLYGYFMTGDSAGNLYYSDYSYNRVRKYVKSTGTVLSIAGNGVEANGGDLVAATSTSINKPIGLAVDFRQYTLGNLFWVELSFNRLRKYTLSTGLVSTLIGGYGGGYAGDGLNITSSRSQVKIYGRGVWSNSRGDLFIADTNNYRVRSIVNQIINTVAGNGLLSYGGDGGPATSAYINTPGSVWGDTLGTVYFTDMNNYRIRAISAAGIITTLGGTGKNGPFTADGTAFTSMSLSNIQALSGDSNGNIYFFDSNYLRRYVISSSSVQTLAGAGTSGYNGNNVSASSVYFSNPRAIWVNTMGDVYIADSDNQRVRLYNKAAGRVWDFAGNGSSGYKGDNVPATRTTVNPFGVWGDTVGNVFICDNSNLRIRRVLLNGIITTFAGNGVFGFGTNGVPATST
eukprot:gene14444-biopygen3304